MAAGAVAILPQAEGQGAGSASTYQDGSAAQHEHARRKIEYFQGERFAAAFGIYLAFNAQQKQPKTQKTEGHAHKKAARQQLHARQVHLGHYGHLEGPGSGRCCPLSTRSTEPWVTA